MLTKIYKAASQWSGPILRVGHSPTKARPGILAPEKVGTYVFMTVALLAETITIFVGIVAGVLLHGALLVGLANLSYFSKTPAARRMYLAYSLVPLVRILSVAMPVQLVPLVYRYVMVGIPLALSTIVVAWFNGLPSLRLNLTLGEWSLQYLIGVTGVPLGTIAYLLLKPSPEILVNRSIWSVVQQAVFLTVFGAVLEEVIFRGLLQKALSYSFGFYSVLLSSILYAGMFLGTYSPSYLLFYGITGLFFASVTQYTDSIWGSVVAHSLMNVVFLLMFYMP